MADLKKAIAAVKYGIRAAECAGNGKKLGRSAFVIMHTDDLDDILELLKAQEPIEPVEIVNERYPVGDPNRTIGWKCGKCGNTIMGIENYCPECGRAVAWE